MCSPTVVLYQAMAHRDRHRRYEDHEPFKQEQSAARNNRRVNLKHDVLPVSSDRILVCESRDYDNQEANDRESEMRSKRKLTETRCQVISRQHRTLLEQPEPRR
jgi:hypothetical protein